MTKKYEKCLTPKYAELAGIRYPVDCSQCRVCKEHIALLRQNIEDQIAKKQKVAALFLSMQVNGSSTHDNH